MFKLDQDNIDQDEEFLNLEVDKMKTNKLEYSYKNNIIYITNNNCKNLVLNENDSDSLIITNDSEMDIHIKLKSKKVGTNFRILITNIQKTFKISCDDSNDKIIGQYKFYHNSNIIEVNSKENKLKKLFILKSIDAGNEILYIPHYDYGLYNGGFLELNYLGTNYNNIPEVVSNQTSDLYEGKWILEGNLVGFINIPKYITLNSNIKLKLYINLQAKKIHSVSSILNNQIYFNKLYDFKNFLLFFNQNYNIIELIDYSNNSIIYTSNVVSSSQNYNIQIKNKNGVYIDIKDKLNLHTINSEIDFIISQYDILNNQIKNVVNQNILNYKIITTNNSNIILEGFINIIDINAYYNGINDSSNGVVNEINSENLLFNVYNGFSDSNNNIIF